MGIGAAGRRLVAFAIAVVVVTASPGAAHATTPTTTRQGAPDPPHLVAGQTVALGASVSPWQAGDGGTIALTYRAPGGPEIPIATLPVANGAISTVFPAGEAVRPPDGRYALIARYSGSGTLAPSEDDSGVLLVGPYDTIVMLDVLTPRPDGTARQHDTVELGARIYPFGYAGQNQPEPTGAVHFAATNGASVVDLGTAMAPHAWITFDAATLAAGSWQVDASYAGDTTWAPSITAPADLTVLPNVVEASSVGISATSIYPIVDGYRDTIRISGSRQEALSVSVRIVNSLGHIVRSWSLASAPGTYAISWNGRTSSGVLLPAGTYRIVQALVDPAGARLVVTSSVALSPKRLYWYTSTLSRRGASYTSSSRSGTARIITSGVPYWGGVRLCCGSSTSVPGYFAAVGYTFTMPAAARYGALTIRFYGNGRIQGLTGMAGIQDWTRSTSTTTFVTSRGGFPPGNFGPLVSLPPGYHVTALPVSAATNVHNRLVRAIVKQTAGTTDVARVTLTVRYAVLR